MSWGNNKDKFKKSSCHNAILVDGVCSAPDGRGGICGKPYNPADLMPAPMPSFIEPKEADIVRTEPEEVFEQPGSPIIGGYSVGEDAECMPGYKEPKTGQSANLYPMPERYKDPENRKLL